MPPGAGLEQTDALKLCWKMPNAALAERHQGLWLTLVYPHGHKLPCSLQEQPCATQEPCTAGIEGSISPFLPQPPPLPLLPTQISLERLETGDEFKVITITF